MHAEYLRSYGSVLPHHHPELPEGRCCLLAFVDRDARRVRSRLRRRIAAPSSSLIEWIRSEIFGSVPNAPHRRGPSASPGRSTGCGTFTRSGLRHDVLIGRCSPSSSCGSWFGTGDRKRTSTRQLAGGAKCWLGGAAEIAHGARATGIQLNQAREWTGCARCLMSCELFTT
jgi:hypothetical protein